MLWAAQGRKRVVGWGLVWWPKALDKFSCGDDHAHFIRSVSVFRIQWAFCSYEERLVFKLTFRINKLNF